MNEQENTETATNGATHWCDYKQKAPFRNLNTLCIDETCLSCTEMQTFTYWILTQTQVKLILFENHKWRDQLNYNIRDQFFNLCGSNTLQTVAIQNIKTIEFYSPDYQIMNRETYTEYFANVQSLLNKQKLESLRKVFYALTSQFKWTEMMKLVCLYLA